MGARRLGENKKVPPARSVHVGVGRGLCRPGSRALTSDPGSSPRSPGAARPLFTQDPSRGPCSCRARVLPNPSVPRSVPSPSPPAPGEDSPAGNPRPAPTPEPEPWRPRREQSGFPGPAGPRGRGRAGRGPAARPLGRPRPGPVDYWSARSRAFSLPRGPSLSAEARGGNEDGCSLRLPPTLFLVLGGERRQSNLRCPVLARQVARGPTATRPRYVNLAPPDLRSEPAGPRRPCRASPRPDPAGSPANRVVFLP